MRFIKMHGLGNDFVVLDWRDQSQVLTPDQARFLADRRFGVGCDQVIVLLPSTKADLKMQIFNADGGAAGMCGNAARCIAGLVQQPSVIETSGGLFPAHLEVDGQATILMGHPKREWTDIPLAEACDTNDISLEGLSGVAVNVGNPHIVFFTDGVDAIDLTAIGPRLEHHKLFPERINVEFVQIMACDHLKIRVWERGAGITAACGTGATASFVAARAKGLCANKARIEMPGGSLVLGEQPDGQITQTGAWVKVFEGEIDV